MNNTLECVFTKCDFDLFCISLSSHKLKNIIKVNFFNIIHILINYMQISSLILKIQRVVAKNTYNIVKICTRAISRLKINKRAPIIKLKRYQIRYKIIDFY